jgi:hypothetical protein
MTLNLESFDDKSKKKNKTKYKAALGVGSAVSLFGIGSTLAANITLSGDNNVEFGQGVVTTAACDEDGFSITPVTYFDNQDEIFKVDYVQVSGVNLTPEGAGYAAGGYSTQSDAKAARPGKYYDEATSTWKNTCDGVVLDFKAYTDDVLYLNRTIINNAGTGNLQNPIGWYQDPDNGDPNQFPGFAIVINILDGGSGNESNYAVASTVDSFYTSYMDLSDVISSAADSSFRFNVDYLRYNGDVITNYKTNAASISKITVQSMDKFPSSYYAWREGLGEPVSWTNSQT